ncbi:hypothetical protein MY4824_008145 [Beauveria thailandica]
MHITLSHANPTLDEENDDDYRAIAQPSAQAPLRVIPVAMRGSGYYNQHAHIQETAMVKALSLLPDACRDGVFDEKLRTVVDYGASQGINSASQSQPGDADDEDDGQRRVKSKTSPTQSNLLDGETRKRMREAANESRLTERESANGSSEAQVKREKSESNERSATPQAQTGPRFNNKYMEEY